MRPERGGITTSARPGAAIEQRVLALAGRRLLAEREVHLRRECCGRFGFAAQQQVVALGDHGPAQRPGGFALLNGDELQPGIAPKIDRQMTDMPTKGELARTRSW